MHRSPIQPEREGKVQAEGRVRLDVLVTDEAGKPISGLGPKDFTVVSDNQAQKIVSFHAFDGVTAKPDSPVQMILVVDAVNSGFSELSFVREGLAQYLLQAEDGGHLAQPVSILMLTVNGLQKLAAPSSDGNALAAVVQQIRPTIRPLGGDDFPLSVMALSHIAQEQGKLPGRKLLIWLGPGWPTTVPNPTVMTQKEERDRQSHFNLVIQLSTELREAETTLYGGYSNSAFYERDFLKGVKKVTDEDPRNLSLGVLALQSGGRGGLAYVNRDSDVLEQLNSFTAEANAYYSLSFDPPRADQADEYHDLKVVVDKPSLTARTRTGYYSEPVLSQPQEPPARAVPPRTPVRRIPEFVGRPVTVAELEAKLREFESMPDVEAAKEIAQLALTERLSSAKLAFWKAALRGEKEWTGLVAVADSSVFLPLPDAEIPAMAVPDLAEQRRIVAFAVDYLAKIIPRLPNFYATRTTTRFEDAREDRDRPGSTILTGEPLHVAGSSRVIVIYRDGNEVLRSVKGKGRNPYPEEKGLITKGTFGPILSTVMVDAAHSEMKFSHWEQGSNGAKAVFAFAVPKDKSHYAVAYRSPNGGDKSYDLQQNTGYHGEVAIDPKTGTILRLAIEADFDLDAAMVRADIMVEYGTVDIGGKTYTCPLRSVSLSKGHAVILMRDVFENGTALGPEMTRLNDVEFGLYHLFRGDVRIVTVDPAAPEEK